MTRKMIERCLPVSELKENYKMYDFVCGITRGNLPPDHYLSLPKIAIPYNGSNDFELLINMFSFIQAKYLFS